MPRLTPVDWRILVKVFEADGFQQNRTKGSHLVMTKSGVLRPIIIPMHGEVQKDVILSNLRSAGMSRERYFELFGKLSS